jgi:hypothetical protein
MLTMIQVMSNGVDSVDCRLRLRFKVSKYKFFNQSSKFHLLDLIEVTFTSSSITMQPLTDEML